MRRPGGRRRLRLERRVAQFHVALFEGGFDRLIFNDDY